MKFRASRFNTNIYWLLVPLCIALLGFGCQSTEKKRAKQITALQIHVESPYSVSNYTKLVSIPRQNPTEIRIESIPFLVENAVKAASVVDDAGGFSIKLEFDRRGSWLLEQYTGSNPQKHLAIFSQFCGPNTNTLNVSRWLGAPRISKRITDGVLVFTPDASREEAVQIVHGLNVVSEKNKKEANF